MPSHPRRKTFYVRIRQVFGLIPTSPEAFPRNQTAFLYFFYQALVCLISQWHRFREAIPRVKAEMENTAAGLSGILTRFPFNRRPLPERGEPNAPQN